MSSLALALKYRPKRFCDLVGQEAVSQTLSMALDKDRVVHAYLFSGLRGSGKTSSARIFARALECEQGPTSTPCGECDICKATLEGRNIDIMEMDAASNRSIDSIRDLIEQTKYAPTMSRFKVFIIDEVHMLTKEAFNALLKTLEEPPPYVKFILATTDPLKLPATILSRTQHFRFKKIPHKAVIAHLEMILEKEGVGFEPGALDIIARSGGGSLRDTLTLTDQAINYCDKYLTIPQVTQMLGIVDPKNLQDFFASIMHDDEQAIVRCLEVLGEYECEMIIDEMLIFLKDMLLSKSKDFPLLLIDRFLGILSQAKSLLHLNPDGAFVLLLISLKMREAMKLKDISDVIARLESTPGIFTAPNAGVDSGVDSLGASNAGGALGVLESSAKSSNTESSKAESGEAESRGFDAADSAQVAGALDSGASAGALDSSSTAPAATTAPESSALKTHAPQPQAQEDFHTNSPQSPSGNSAHQASSQAIYQQAFATLVAKIADRSYELGEAFKRSVHFGQFVPAPTPNTPSTLYWCSNGDEADRAVLRQYFGLIREFAKEVFAPDTELVIKNLQPESKTESKLESSAAPSVDSAPNIATPISTQDHAQNHTQAPAQTQAPQPAPESSIAKFSTPESSVPAPRDSALDSGEPTNPPSQAPITQKDLILHSMQEVRPDHIAPEILNEVPWSRDKLVQTPAQNPAQTPAGGADSGAYTNPSAPSPESTSSTNDTFKQENHALIQGIKQHFGATSMRVEHNGA